jgi:succinate dehydrogenase / fumarate reductase flavoprotein subunit
MERTEAGCEVDTAGVSRRDFFKGVGLTAATTALATTVLAGVGCSTSNSTPTKEKEAVRLSSEIDFDLYETDVLVLGAGLGGIHAALEAYGADLRVLVVDKGPHKSSGVSGMNWDIGSKFYREPSLPTDVTEAPWNAGYATWTDGLVNRKVSRAIEAFHGNTEEAWHIPLTYARLGNTSFSRKPDGSFEKLYENPDTSMTGVDAIFPRPLADAMSSLDITVVDNTIITELLVVDNTCVGAMGFDVTTGRYRVFRAKATITATGGCCQMYGWLKTSAVSINTPDNTGDVDAAAYRHGCSLVNAEFLATDLVSLVPDSFGASFCAGLGADSTNQKLVCDIDGNFFLREPSPAGYVPVFRRAIDVMREGKGGEHGGVFMDYSDPEMDELSRKCYTRNIELWKQEFGLDPTEPGYKVAIGVECFEHMANAVVDENMMTEIPGLFNVRGFGNMIILIVSHPAAAYAGFRAAEYAKNSSPTEFDLSAIEQEIARLEEIRSKEGSIRPHVIRHAIQGAVYDAFKLGLDANGLEKAIDEIERIKTEDLPNMAVLNKTKCFNTEWKQAVENYNILDIAEATLKAALLREESRGFFYRTDYPDASEDWLAHIHVHSVDGKMELTKVPLEA